MGHLNTLRIAKEHCGYLIVGVTTDELVSCENAQVVEPCEERIKTVKAISFINEVVSQLIMGENKSRKGLKFSRVFVRRD